MELSASFQYGDFIFAHVRATRRATDACQIGKESVLSAGLSVRIQKRQIATERSLSLLVCPGLNALIQSLSKSQPSPKIELRA